MADKGRSRRPGALLEKFEMLFDFHKMKFYRTFWDGPVRGLENWGNYRLNFLSFFSFLFWLHKFDVTTKLVVLFAVIN